MRIRLCGISDEAGRSLQMQIQAHQSLGWNSIELRTVRGKGIAQLSDAEFATVQEAIVSSGLSVEVVGSFIGNWERPVLGPLDPEREELEKLLERAVLLKAKNIRVMSYLRGDASEQVWRDDSVRKLRLFCDMSLRFGISLLHENCTGWGSQSPWHSVEMCRLVDRPNFGLIFDMGNAALENTSPLLWLQEVHKHVMHVHVKDLGSTTPPVYVMPGEGRAEVMECLSFLVSRGYSGAISIEPHIDVVAHEKKWSSSRSQFLNYLKYGTQLEALLAQVYQKEGVTNECQVNG